MNEFFIFLLGFVFGMCLLHLCINRKLMGVIRTYSLEDEEDPYFYLELQGKPKDILKAKRVSFLVKEGKVPRE